MKLYIHSSEYGYVGMKSSITKRIEYVHGIGPYDGKVWSALGLTSDDYDIIIMINDILGKRR
jgi:hypothetical protein